MNDIAKMALPGVLVVAGIGAALFLKKKEQPAAPDDDSAGKTAREVADAEKERIAKEVRSENARKASRARWDKKKKQADDA